MGIILIPFLIEISLAIVAGLRPFDFIHLSFVPWERIVNVGNLAIVLFQSIVCFYSSFRISNFCRKIVFFGW